MKKLLALLLALIFVFSLAACSDKAPANDDTNNDSNETSNDAKFGLGIDVVYDSSDADGDKKGSATVDVTAAALLIGEDGKIISCKLDATSNALSFTSAGEAEDSNEFKTKREVGDNYGMVAYGGAKLEWYAQADAFDAICAGKAKADLEAYVAGDKADLISAGCTIYIGDMAKAAIKSLDVK